MTSLSHFNYICFIVFMKHFFLIILICCFFESSFSQVSRINLLVPARNVKPFRKIPMLVNDVKLIMKEGSYAILQLNSDTARISFSAPGWKVKNAARLFVYDKDIFIVAYFDKFSSSSNKYFLREVTLETYNHFRKKCRTEIYPTY